jgi:flagellar hook-basal body complex protein FliE
MAIAPLPPIGAVTGPAAPGAATPARPAAPGFGEALRSGLAEVSQLEHAADATTQAVATGDAQIHDLMIATTKAQLGVEMLVQVRNRAVEAYQEIMRLQV